MTRRRHSIVCLSSQRWDDGMWTNKQHVMSRLGEDHDVYHVDFGPRPLGRVLLQALGGQVPPLPPHRLLTRPRVRKRDGVTVLDFYAPGLSEVLPRAHPLRTFAAFELRLRLLGRYLRRHRISSPILWVYHPGYGADVARLPHELLVYDCVDEYTAFPELARARRWIAQREAALCRRADLVFTTAASLQESKRRYNPEHTHLVHNVGDATHFNRALDPELEVPEELARLPRPVIGFVGAVSDYKLDLDWLLHLGRARPDFSLVLIGPTGLSDPGTDVSRLAALPNVHLFGHRDYRALPAYVKGFDVAVIPYRINEYTRGVFPIKFFELMASGRPVVISNLPALEEYYPHVLVARTADELVDRCEAALGDSAHARSVRLELAARNTWSDRVRALWEHVEGRLSERADWSRR